MTVFAQNAADAVVSSDVQVSDPPGFGFGEDGDRIQPAGDHRFPSGRSVGAKPAR